MFDGMLGPEGAVVALGYGAPHSFLTPDQQAREDLRFLDERLRDGDLTTRKLDNSDGPPSMSCTVEEAEERFNALMSMDN